MLGMEAGTSDSVTSEKLIVTNHKSRTIGSAELGPNGKGHWENA